jgi:hypothetical protein
LCSEEGIEGRDSFLDEIEEINRFKEKDFDDEGGEKYTND